MKRDELVEKMLKNIGDRNNIIDIDAYARGLIDMYEQLKNCNLQNVSNNEVAVCPECGCNKTIVVDDETWCLNKLCGAEWQTDC